MSRSRVSVAALALALFALADLPTNVAAFSVLASGASCAPGDHVTVSWTFYDDPDSPTQVPEWIGYDLLRTPGAQCGPPVRLTDEPMPRGAGPIDLYAFLDESAIPGAAYFYSVIPVNAAREAISIPACECQSVIRTNCPIASTPALRGTVAEDWGWTVYLMPCDDTCYPSVYIEGPGADALRPYVGTGMSFDFYGSVGCGGVEGCGLVLSRYEPAACGSTPTRAASWGQLKAAYR